MPVISDAAIAGFAKTAGLSGQAVAVAVAVALAESGGNTQDHNVIPPDNSYGLWQINMLGDMGPERRARYGLRSNEDLYDPAINARVMAGISNVGRDWSAWTTYTRGTYRLYLNRGNAVAGTATLQPNTSQAIPIGSQSTLESTIRFLRLLSMPGTWVRIGLLTIGAGLVFFGLLKITGNNELSSTTKGLVKGAVGLLPGGGTVTTALKVVK